MPLTVTRTPLASIADNTPGQGGTALQSGSSPNWLWIAGAVLVVGIAILVFSGGSSNDDKTEAAIEVDDSDEDAPIEDNTRSVNTTRSAPNEIETANTEVKQSKREVISELESLLNQSRLWVTLSVLATSDSTLSIVSGSCEDAAMKTIIRKSAAKLKAVAFVDVHCFAKHGELLFSETL